MLKISINATVAEPPVQVNDSSVVFIQMLERLIAFSILPPSPETIPEPIFPMRLIRRVEGYLTYNFKGNLSGGLLIDKYTGELLTGFGLVNGHKYVIVPLAHVPNQAQNWTMNTSDYIIYTTDSSPEFAERAIAEAQMEYAKND